MLLLNNILFNNKYSKKFTNNMEFNKLPYDVFSS